ncbi:Knottin [Corchorus olitorius]|uniref:Knottin n=1 Tax=Corchorus olitorius TaxID=93759 RepID=A0A1R3JIN5_9ROSI|nr:Knottin [Corchorus olitorius]
MEVMRKLFGMMLLLFLVLASQDMVVPSEARLCQSQSHGFKGGCLSNHNCALVCRNEGFSGGQCRGLRHRCFCTRRC